MPFQGRKKETPGRDVQREYFRSMTGLELRVEALVKAIRDSEAAGNPLTPAYEHLVTSLEAALKTYRDAKAELRKPRD